MKDQDKPAAPDEDSVENTEQFEGSNSALGAALAEAAGDAASANCQEDDADQLRFKPAGKRAWTGRDSILALVLAVNVLFMALMVFAPWPNDAKPADGGQGQTGKGVDSKGKGGTQGVGSLEPRSPLYSQAEKLFVQGKSKEAVAKLEELLQLEPNLHDSVRRAIYMRLAYYCGIASLPKKSNTYRLMAQAGMQRGLLPEDLWSMAEEAYRLKDYALARRYTARFLLQEGLMAEREKKTKPLAYLKLADGYRLQADEKTEEQEEKNK